MLSQDLSRYVHRLITDQLVECSLRWILQSISNSTQLLINYIYSLMFRVKPIIMVM